ncbi:MAG: PIN domain-containing protein [Polyangiaceae bacterium]|nr:PIN domain-containing protein [Polyangiaceae bacterium]
MGKKNPSKVVLVFDTGALIAFEKGDPKMRALVRAALENNVKVVVPTPVVAQALRDKKRQVALVSLLGGKTTETVPLTLPLAEAAGSLCGSSRTSDIVDATVVLVAKQFQALIVTSDEGDLRRLDPTAHLEQI